MEYSYKFRIYPNMTQIQQIQKTFGCCRFVFNHFLAERKEQYEQTGKSPTRFQQSKSLTTLKKELEWLREADSTALQSSLQSFWNDGNLHLHTENHDFIIRFIPSIEINNLWMIKQALENKALPMKDKLYLIEPLTAPVPELKQK